MKTAFKTDIGQIRTVNEDRAAIQDLHNGYTLAIVADGMGGHQAGEIASGLAIETILAEMALMPSGLTLQQCEETIRQAVLKANEAIWTAASGEEGYQGMGTTVVVSLASESGLIVAHIGDSRAYILQDGIIEQLTEDHSLVNELVKSGQISPEEADDYPRRNVLTRALGTDRQVEVDIRYYLWKPNDVLLLCSDGLSGMIKREQISEIVSRSGSLEQAVEQLVSAALKAGGDDNITVVLMENDFTSQSMQRR